MDRYKNVVVIFKYLYFNDVLLIIKVLHLNKIVGIN